MWTFCWAIDGPRLSMSVHSDSRQLITAWILLSTGREPEWFIRSHWSETSYKAWPTFSALSTHFRVMTSEI